MEPRTVTAGDVRLVIREARLTDVDRLARLYQRLDRRDVHRRFFTGGQPDPRVIATWVDQNRLGGVVLIVIAGEDSDPDAVIAEVGVARSGDDTGELAIAVDPHWRGWLGPFLVDLVLAAAARVGIIRVVVDTLATNTAMRSIIEARGGVVELGDDPTTLRLVVATDRSIPSWPPGTDGGRVLVEGGLRSWGDAMAAVRSGITVMVCGGPGRHPHQDCPVLRGQPCPLAHGADAIIVATDPDAAETAELISRHRDAKRWVLAPGSGVEDFLAGLAQRRDSTAAAT